MTHDNGKLWLRDFLPAEIPGTRIFTFGYDAKVAFSQSTADLEDFAQSLLDQLKQYRSGKVNRSPNLE